MRLIDADNLYDDVLHDGDYENDTINHFLDMVSAQPDVDAEPVRHGKLIEKGSGYDWYFECSECHCNYKNGFPMKDRYKYCPYCGAKMDLE